MFFEPAGSARHARILKRRAARAQRSKWLGRLLFSLSGAALFLVFRLYPDLVDDIVARAHNVAPRTDHTSFTAPQDVYVRTMPSDAVPVRRWGSEHDIDIDTQARAETLAEELKELSPDG